MPLSQSVWTGLNIGQHLYLSKLLVLIIIELVSPRYPNILKSNIVQISKESSATDTDKPKQTSHLWIMDSRWKTIQKTFVRCLWQSPSIVDGVFVRCLWQSPSIVDGVFEKSLFGFTVAYSGTIRYCDVNTKDTAVTQPICTAKSAIQKWN